MFLIKKKSKFFLPVVAVFLILSALLSVFVLIVNAAGPGQQNLQDPGQQNPNEFPNPLNAKDFTQLFVSIANWVAGIVATVAVLLIVIAGLQYIFSGGDTDKIEKAHKTIKWALIGLIIVLMSWSLLNTVLTLLNVK